ncbi:hypothetical protein ACFQZC_38660 [Streptacidiphilus monticola]
MGQRRMLAAQAAAKAAQEKDEPVRLVPAIVHEIKDSDDVEAVLLSLIENEHRAAMTETDKVEAVAQLSLLTDGNATRRRRAARALGLSADEVAAATRAKELKQETLSHAASAQMSLLDMADLVEVEGMPNAMRELSEAKKRDAAEGKGGRGHWQHAMSKLRQQQETTARIEATRTELKAAQVPEVRAAYWTGYGEKPKQLDLSELRTDLGNPLTATMHAACPGHAARIDTETGQAVYVCRDPKAYGHKLPPKPPRTSAPRRSRPSTPAPSPTTGRGRPPARCGTSSSPNWSPGRRCPIRCSCSAWRTCCTAGPAATTTPTSGSSATSPPSSVPPSPRSSARAAKRSCPRSPRP